MLAAIGLSDLICRPSGVTRTKTSPNLNNIKKKGCSSTAIPSVDCVTTTCGELEPR